MGEPLPSPDFQVLFDLAPAPLLLLSPDFAVVRANRQWLAGAGRTPAADQLGTFLERVREQRRPDRLTVRSTDLPRHLVGGAPRVWTFSAVPVPAADGELAFLLLRADDVTSSRRQADRIRSLESALDGRRRELAQVETELRQLRERERRGAHSVTGLATTVSALAAAESREDLLRQLFRHGRTAFDADALAVALVEPGGARLTVVDTSGADGPQPARPLPIDSPLPIAAAAAGRPVYQSDAEQNPALPPPLPGLRAWAALPLHFGRRPLGSLTVGWRRPRPLGDEDVRLLEALAAQCAQALDRVARLETERRQAAATRSLAEVLQRSLLTDPPQPEDMDIAVRYRPAAREAQVGGDWYDAFVSPAGIVTVAVGDVTGHDRTAAAVAGQMRNMLRGIVCALDDGDPARILTTLDGALQMTGGSPLATALVARIERPRPGIGSDHWTLRWSNAGHPPPLLIQPEGSARLLQPPSDLLLGVAPDARRRQHAVPVAPGATVLLYTDGLIERHDATLDDGLARLLESGAGLATRPVDQFCDELFTRLQPDLTDDIALLALRAHSDPAG